MNDCNKPNDKLSKVITMLKNQLQAKDNALETYISPDSDKINNNSTKESTSDKKDLAELLGLPENRRSPDWRSQEDSSLCKSYLMFENNSNLCWLDSSMSLLCHNKTLANVVNEESSSQIAYIMKHYQSAISIVNDYSNESTIEEKLKKPKAILQKIQDSVMAYLKPILKCKEGEPDSAFCALLNLISENKQIKNLFLVEFSMVRNCTKCKIPRIRNNKKTIITMSQVVTFCPSSPVSLCRCPICECKDQEVKIKYKTLPQCLIFHFENGAGEGELESLDFAVNDRKYKLSGLIKLERSHDLTVSHFVTFIRDIASDSWLECNDLKSEILSYSVVPPVINLKDIYIIMFEALDDKGTSVNITEDSDDTFKIEFDDTSSSDIPVIDLSDEDENKETKQDQMAPTTLLQGAFKSDKTDNDRHEKIFKPLDIPLSYNIFSSKSTLETFQRNAESKKGLQQDKGMPNMVFCMGGLFKPDKTDYDSEEEISKRLDEILSDNNFSVKSTLKTSENDANLKEERLLPAENSELQNLDFQDNTTSPSVKTDDAPLLEDELSESALSNSIICENGPKNNVADSIKQSEITDSSQMSMMDETKPVVSSNSKITSLGGISSSTEENLPLKNLANAFENQDINKNSNSLRKSPVQNQDNELDLSAISETKNLSLKSCNSSSKNSSTPFENLDNNQKAGCSRQNSVEPCARTLGVPASHKKSKKFSAVPKKLRTVENEQFAGDAAVDSLDNEKTDGTSMLSDFTLHTSVPQKQLQNSCITLSTLPENKAVVKMKKANDIPVLKNESVDTFETKTQDIDTSLPLESHIVGKKAFGNTSTEVKKGNKSTAAEPNHILSIFKTSLNHKDDKTALNLFENEAQIGITRNGVAKHGEIFSNEVCIEDIENLTVDSTIKQHKVDTKLLECDAFKELENKNSTSFIHQTTNQSNTTKNQHEHTLAFSAKSNDQLNVQTLECSENASLNQTTKFDQKETIISPNELETKNLPSKSLFVQLTRMKDSEVTNYIQGNFNLKEAKQIKSLEELTKTIVVKVEKTDSKSILKRSLERTVPSKVEIYEPVRKSSRIYARMMQKNAVVKKEKKSLLETVTSPKKRKNSQEQILNNVFTKQSTTERHQTLKVLPEVTDKTLKKKDLPERAKRTRSAKDVSSSIHLGSNTIRKSTSAKEGRKVKHRRTMSIEAGNTDVQPPFHPQISLEVPSSSQVVYDDSDILLKVVGSNTKRKSKDDEGVKVKRRRKKPFKARSSDVQMHLQTQISLEGSSLVHDESDVLSRVLGTSLKENSLVSTNNYPVALHNAVHTEDQIQVVVSRSSAVESSVKSHFDRCEAEDGSSDCQSDSGTQVYERIEHYTNNVFNSVFHYFLSPEIDLIDE